MPGLTRRELLLSIPIAAAVAKAKADDGQPSELWDIVAGSHGPKLTREQEDKYHEYTWERVALNRNASEEEIARLGNLYTVRVIVRWGNGRTSKREEESYVTFWRKKE